MKIAIAADGFDLESLVSKSFAGCNYLVIAAVEDHLMGDPMRITGITLVENQINNTEFSLASELIRFDCEAVITGALEAEDFTMIADSCITRFYGVGCTISEALEKMDRNELDLIRNLEGTAGCDSTHHKHEEE